MAESKPENRRNKGDKGLLEMEKENEAGWQLAKKIPYSSSIGGEYVKTVNGNRGAPRMHDIMEVSKKAKMNEKKAQRIASEIRDSTWGFEGIFVIIQKVIVI